MKKKSKILISAFVFAALSLTSGVLWAQGKFDQPVSKPLVILIALVALALVPILLTMVTSFVKIAVVLALIRNALGTQQIPPNQIITGLAMILTIYIMVPVGMDIYRETGSVIESSSNQGFFSQATVALLQEGFKKGREPMRAFLLKNAGEKDRVLFFNLAKRMRKGPDRESLKSDDFMILIPSFVVSELSEAFQIGFVIFLPFLVIDMVVANILLALGMFQLSPITVSLPFKLLLFVLVDGWYLIARGLILGYV
ncbi:MAG TPA: EscR/YscR/HrcR family type III secretion system export apparatus protein [Deltaproteobacteria bacterium]|nr:EscR/YscR/HrcR family type III secretion system export apparatus protein [Deltaproteobacteria bacterium]